jgi:hypothetical protein
VPPLFSDDADFSLIWRGDKSFATAELRGETTVAAKTDAAKIAPNPFLEVLINLPS